MIRQQFCEGWTVRREVNEFAGLGVSHSEEPVTLPDDGSPVG